MEKSIALTFLSLTIIALSGCADRSDNFTPISTNLATPESIALNDDNTLLYISNINGNPTGKNDNGYISTYDPSGTPINLKFISGDNPSFTLHAPKGIALSGGHLWVTDIDAVKKFDANTGKFIAEISIQGATFLNDITSDRNGGVLVTDSGLAPDFSPSGSDAIYHISNDNSLTKIIKDVSLNRPNGILMVDDDRFVMVNFAEKGMLRTFTLDGEELSSVPMPYGMLDGVQQDENETLLISSWALGGIISVTSGSSHDVLQTGLDAPADIAYDAKHGRLYIPLFKKNMVEAMTLGHE